MNSGWGGCSEMGFRRRASNRGENRKPDEQGKNEEYGQDEDGGEQECNSASYLIFRDRDDCKHYADCYHGPVEKCQQYRLGYD